MVHQFLDYILGACRADRKTAGQGAGEGGIGAGAAAIGNAVAAARAARGVEPKELPLTPARIWRLVQDAQNDSGGPGAGTMTIDIHAHYVPAELISLARTDGSRLG